VQACFPFDVERCDFNFWSSSQSKGKEHRSRIFIASKDALQGTPLRDRLESSSRSIYEGRMCISFIYVSFWSKAESRHVFPKLVANDREGVTNMISIILLVGNKIDE